MEPPICTVCQVDFRDVEDGGALVEFAKSAHDLEWDRRAAAEGFVGHPPYAAWFCTRHLTQARGMGAAGLTLAEASARMQGTG